MKMRACWVMAMTFGLLVLAASGAEPSTWNVMQPWRIATQAGFQSFWLPSGQTCQNDDSNRCEELPASAGAVYTADYAAAYEWEVADATDGEVVGISATEPDGTVVAGPAVTYHSTSNNPPLAEWTDQNGNIVAYEPQGFGEFISGILQVNCGPIGNWSMSLSDNSATISTTPFTLGHGSPFLSISSPTDNELFQLIQNNYTATDPIQFLAVTGSGNPINWTVSLHYLSSSGYGGPDPTPLTFSGTSYDYSGYQSVGGQITATAQTTAVDGSTLQDCVTYYAEGPETTDSGTTDGINDGGLTGGSGIPNTSITSRLDQLYTSSYS